MKKLVLLLAIGLALPAQAAAQEKTVAGAQEFLRLASNQFRFTSSWLESGNGHFVYKDMKLEPMAPCVTRVSGVLSWEFDQSRSDSNVSNAINLQRYIALYRTLFLVPGGWSQSQYDNWINSLMRLPSDINWSSVTSVEAVSAKTYGAPDTLKRVIVILAGKRHYSITTSDEAIAARVAFAAEFLRLNCDTTASTGF